MIQLQTYVHVPLNTEPALCCVCASSSAPVAWTYDPASHCKQAEAPVTRAGASQILNQRLGDQLPIAFHIWQSLPELAPLHTIRYNVCMRVRIFVLFESQQPLP
jgi:hypothetical protein